MLHFARWKIILVAVIAVLGIVLALPNLFSETALKSFPSFLPSQKMNLGLDLQGGSHLLLEVDTPVVIKERLETVRDDARAALREARIGYRGLNVRDNSVTVRIREADKYDEALSRLEELSSPITTNLFSAATARDLIIESGDADNEISITLSDFAVEERIRSAVDQSLEIIRRRVDELGTTEPTIQRQGLDRIILQVPGFGDPARLKELVNTDARLTFHLVDLSSTVDNVGAGSMVLPSGDADNPADVVVRRRVMVSGEDLVDAQPAFDQQTNQPVINFRFDSSGAKRFGDVTAENVGRPFAIVLDGVVISAPVIREAILGGSGQISGGFTVEGANDLAILLRAGALPAPLEILEERTVGPGLGADAIAAGEIAAVIGMVAVVVFIILTYGLFGIFANIALAVNIALIIGVLSLLQATLTLPGIAGIVLTIGMAVDANVLIFERIKEEVRLGKTPIAAIEAGYSRALSTILDANITTFIAAAILFQMGSGPVRGFAVTLAIGIITSVFTAFTLSRMFVALWVRRRRPAAVPI